MVLDLRAPGDERPGPRRRGLEAPHRGALLGSRGAPSPGSRWCGRSLDRGPARPRRVGPPVGARRGPGRDARRRGPVAARRGRTVPQHGAERVGHADERAGDPRAAAHPRRSGPPVRAGAARAGRAGRAGGRGRGDLVRPLQRAPGDRRPPGAGRPDVGRAGLAVAHDRAAPPAPGPDRPRPAPRPRRGADLARPLRPPRQADGHRPSRHGPTPPSSSRSGSAGTCAGGACRSTASWSSTGATPPASATSR